MPLSVRSLTVDEHRGFVAARPSVSFLQCPSWGEVKQGWRHESLGWVDDAGQIVGAGLVLYRQVPRMQKFLAYLPEGPVIDWSAGDLSAWLTPMVKHLKAQNAFAVKMGPPVIARRWKAETIKKAIADGGAKRLGEVKPDATNDDAAKVADALRELGWSRKESEGAGFGDFQPRYVFQVPLAGRSLDDLLKGFNQLWRRNIKKAEKAGVTVARGSADDLPAFHTVYLETAARDHFTGRPLSYFQQMWRAMTAEDPDRLRLYQAHHEGDLVAATLMVRVGEHVWYSYGASTTAKREVRASNAAQWQMIKDAYAMGAAVYDLRGIGDSLDSENHLFGLIQFKLGTGGEAVEYLGEWDLPINKVLHKAFEIYLARR